jgi:hypothetical protein
MEWMNDWMNGHYESRDQGRKIFYCTAIILKSPNPVQATNKLSTVKVSLFQQKFILC